VAALLDLYHVYAQAERDHVLRLARDAFQLPRWEGNFNAPDLGPSMLDYLWLESAAERIRCYGATLVPDLVRTAGYAESVVRRESEPEKPSEAQATWWVEAYQGRQTLNREALTEVQAVVAESVLHRPVGGPARTLPEQLDHLAKAADAGRVQVRVLPVGAGYVPGSDGSFTLFELPEPFPHLAACTGHAHGLAVHEEQTAKRYAQVFDRLWTSALDPSESATLISRIATTLTTDPTS
jgi:hypothetical protein